MEALVRFLEQYPELRTKRLLLRHYRYQDLEDLFEIHNVSGFIVSSLGDFVLLEKYRKDFDFIGNFTLNTFNISSINNYMNLGLSRITLSIYLVCIPITSFI